MHLNVMLVDQCNLRCEMCRHKLNITGEQMPFERYLDIVRQCQGLRGGIYKFTGIRLDGGREGLLYPKIIEAAAAANECGLELSLVSNGVLMHKELGRSLLENGLGFVNFSVTGISPEIYSRFQGYAMPAESCARQLLQVKTNIGDFTRIRDASGAKCGIAVSYILTKHSLADFKNSLFYWKSLGVDVLKVGGDFERRFEKRLEPGDVSRLRYHHCAWFISSLTISANGDVYACCKSNEDIVLGNCFQTPLREILDSRRYYDTARALATLNPAAMPPSCAICADIADRL